GVRIEKLEPILELRRGIVRIRQTTGAVIVGHPFVDNYRLEGAWADVRDSDAVGGIGTTIAKIVDPLHKEQVGSAKERHGKCPRRSANPGDRIREAVHFNALHADRGRAGNAEKAVAGSEVVSA